MSQDNAIRPRPSWYTNPEKAAKSYNKDDISEVSVSERSIYREVALATDSFLYVIVRSFQRKRRDNPWNECTTGDSPPTKKQQILNETATSLE